MCYMDSFLPNGTAVNNNNAAPYVNGAGAALVNWFPKPNADPFTNPFGYNYIKQLPQNQNGSLFRATLQYNINSNNNLFFVYGLQREIDQDPVDVNNQFPTGSIPYPGAVTAGDVSNVLSGRYTRIFGASVTNEFIAAMSFVSLAGKDGQPDRGWTVSTFPEMADSASTTWACTKTTMTFRCPLLPMGPGTAIRIC